MFECMSKTDQERIFSMAVYHRLPDPRNKKWTVTKLRGMREIKIQERWTKLCSWDKTETGGNNLLDPHHCRYTGGRQNPNTH